MMGIMKQVKRKAEIYGRLAELIAVLWFTLSGYRVLAHRWRGRRGEIDLVIKRRNTLVFVEVKFRASLDIAHQSITFHQQKRIKAAAEEWLAARPHLLSTFMRFDGFFLAPWRWPRHIKNAF